MYKRSLIEFRKEMKETNKRLWRKLHLAVLQVLTMYETDQVATAYEMFQTLEHILSKTTEENAKNSKEV